MLRTWIKTALVALMCGGILGLAQAEEAAKGKIDTKEGATKVSLQGDLEDQSSSAAFGALVDIELRIAALRKEASEVNQIERRISSFVSSKTAPILDAISASKGVDCSKDVTKLNHAFDQIVDAMSIYFPLSGDTARVDGKVLPVLFGNFWGAKPDERCRILQAANLQENIDANMAQISQIDQQYIEKKASLDQQVNDLQAEARKNLAAQSAVGNLSRNLPWLILIIAGFAISIILIIRLFEPEMQMEWIASGQVIQFSTVMILLSALMALGLTQILKENTLGTLLGGIAGYVLAQGVGRATARATLNASREANNTIPLAAATGIATAAAAAATRPGVLSVEGKAPRPDAKTGTTGPTGATGAVGSTGAET